MYDEDPRPFANCRKATTWRDCDPGYQPNARKQPVTQSLHGHIEVDGGIVLSGQQEALKEECRATRAAFRYVEMRQLLELNELLPI